MPPLRCATCGTTTGCCRKPTAVAPPVEIYHDAAQALADIQTEFAHGLVSLVERAQAEEVHNCIGLLLQQRLNPGNRVHRALLDELNEKLARKLFVNFSMFQSLPDVWGIDQIFPILPLEGCTGLPPGERWCGT